MNVHLSMEPFKNWRNEDGTKFKTSAVCSVCNGKSEVYIDFISGGVVMRLCKGCMTDGIRMIDTEIIKEVSKPRK